MTSTTTTTVTEFAHLKIPLAEISEATNNFAEKNIIGRGDFGNVYKGKLLRDGKLIKISARRLDRKGGLGDVEFWTEISVLSSFRDMEWGIVHIIGFCNEKDERIIVNEHYAKGSLLAYLSNPILPWYRRFELSYKIVSSISDIHNVEGHGYEIIHCNISSSTILLDDDWKPRLSGFEFSIKRSADRTDQVHHCDALGTKGYIDPAIEKSGGVTVKSDIYSLGVVLFEIMCGRKAYQDNELLAPLVKSHFEKGTLLDIVHPNLRNQIEYPEPFKILSEIAYLCLEEDPSIRPNLTRIMTIIWKATKTYREKDAEPHHDSHPKEENDATEYAESDLWKVHLKKWEHLRIDHEGIERTIDYNEAILKSSYKKYLSTKEGKFIVELPTIVMYKEIIYCEDEALGEMEILSRCRHPNIKKFLGFHTENDLLFVYFENGSFDILQKNLEDRILTWERRLKICIGVACGLNYLHNEMPDQKTVIHRSISSRNIELDNLSRAKIVGFHYSVFLPTNQYDDALHLDDIVDNTCYIDPEYAETGKLGRESDVFSFGIVMLEILFGKSADDVIEDEDCEDRELAPLARRWYEEGILKEKFYPAMKQETYGNNCFLSKGPDENSLDTFLKITYQCLAPTQNERPPMEVVVNELQKALSFQENLKDPFRMSFEDVKLATENFANKIGGGGFGSVYKGNIADVHVNGHKTIVAKKLDTSHDQGEKEFYNELRILQEYRHKNVIDLVGYSNETNEKLIVYEYASEGSLDKYLSKTSLTWRNRLEICIDVVTGLDFLHGGTRGKEVVIHRDIKTANILLFDDWKAKVGDFGLSLISTIDKETKFAIDRACGTMDYVDPLYFKSGLLIIKSDIYSLGVVLFEILYGKAVCTILKHASWSLLNFIKQNVEEGKKDEMVFTGIKEEIVPESLNAFLNIVCKCLDDARERRPTSHEVLVELMKALEFQVSDHTFTYYN